MTHGGISEPTRTDWTNHAPREYPALLDVHDDPREISQHLCPKCRHRVPKREATVKSAEASNSLVYCSDTVADEGLLN